MKKFFTLFAIIMMSLVLLLTACDPATFDPASQEPQSAPFAPWDELKGGEVASAVTPKAFNSSTYLETSIANPDSSLNETNPQNAIAIDLSNLTAQNAPTGTQFSSDVLTINKGGAYILSGTLNGAISVAKIEEDVHIVLNGATITTTNALPVGAIVFKETSAKRILTVKDGTQNTVSDSIGNDIFSGDGAVIQAKRCALSINGMGTLTINAVGQESTGIKAKKTLNVFGTTIKINATNNGITSDERLAFFDAIVTVTAPNDGIKTTTQSDIRDDANAYANDQTMGYVYVKNSSFDITAGDNGISANACLYIDNNNSNLIKIKTNGGTPTTVTSESSDLADGKAIAVSGVKFIAGITETTIAAGYNRGYGIVITGGKFELNSNSDAISSCNNILITGGTINATSGDDAITADYFVYIESGNITVTRAYEGIIGANVIIKNGSVNLTVVNDGIDANNKDLTGYDFYVYIEGGNIKINASGDAINSNDNVHIKGGNLMICGPSDGTDSAMNSESGILIDGGSVCAVGAKGMVQLPASNSALRYLGINLPVAITGGTEITVYDQNGEIYSFTPEQSYQSIILALPQFENNKTYTVKIGVSAYTATFTTNGIALGTNKNGVGNYGYNANFTPPQN